MFFKQNFCLPEKNFLELKKNCKRAWSGLASQKQEVLIHCSTPLTYQHYKNCLVLLRSRPDTVHSSCNQTGRGFSAPNKNIDLFSKPPPSFRGWHVDGFQQ